jgi:hypothetical protein
MAATLFVKGGDEYIRVATTVPNPDGSGRAIGTVLAGPALESAKAGKAYSGEVPVLGTTYMRSMSRSTMHRAQSSALTSLATRSQPLSPEAHSERS